MDMVEIDTSELIGPALDYAVAKAEGYELRRHKYHWTLLRSGIKCGHFSPNKKPDFVVRQAGYWQPSVAWSQGGALIANHGKRIGMEIRIADSSASFIQSGMRIGYTANDVLIAAMRCLVAAEYGDTVQVPAELTERNPSDDNHPPV